MTSKIKIRYNTEYVATDKDSLPWRALIDDIEFFASSVEIHVPVETTSHIVEGGKIKWSIYCESDHYYFDERKRLIITPAENYEAQVLYVGRFQPPHKGHMTIFDESLKEGKKICIAIRNTEPSQENPLEAKVVKQLWEKIYKGNDLVKVIIIPNITAVKYGRNVGYTVEEIKVSDNIASINATAIRNAIREEVQWWKDLVSPLIHEDLEKYLK